MRIEMTDQQNKMMYWNISDIAVKFNLTHEEAKQRFFNVLDSDQVYREILEAIEWDISEGNNLIEGSH